MRGHMDTCRNIKMGNLEESSSVSHAWGLGCEDRGYLSIAVWCDMLQAWEGSIWGRWFSAELSNPSDLSLLHLMLSKFLYCKNCKLCIIYDSLVILDTCTPFRLVITSIESSLQCTSSVLSPAEHFDSSQAIFV